jgi:hypothetical protein
MTSERYLSCRRCHSDKVRKYGSHLSIPETRPPAYQNDNSQALPDDKFPSSCSRCGCSAESKDPPRTLDLVVYAPTEAPTEAPTKGSVFMEKIHELIPKLEIAKEMFRNDEDEWHRAGGTHAQTSAWAQRTISKEEVDTQLVVLQACFSWVADEGVELSGVQSLMSAGGIDMATQQEVNNLWRQMERKRGKIKKL